MTNDKVEIERDNNRLRDEVVYLQSQSMRNNLTFSNIIKTNKDGTEDTLQVLRTFLEDKMKIAKDLIDRMWFERVQRMGRRVRGRHRQIVAKFTLFKEREFVRK